MAQLLMVLSSENLWISPYMLTQMLTGQDALMIDVQPQDMQYTLVEILLAKVLKATHCCSFQYRGRVQGYCSYCCKIDLDGFSFKKNCMCLFLLLLRCGVITWEQPIQLLILCFIKGRNILKWIFISFETWCWLRSKMFLMFLQCCNLLIC